MSDQPNIIFIITDQQRADTIQAAGCEWMITPTLDKLAEKGVLFNQAYCCAATCIASRAALFTGMYAHNTGAYSFDRWEHQRTWLHDFRDAGYYIVNVGKMHHRAAPMAFHERYIVENKSSRLAYDQWNRFLWQSGLDIPRRIDTVPDWARQLNAVTWSHGEEYHSDLFTGNMAINFIERWDGRPLSFWRSGFPGRTSRTIRRPVFWKCTRAGLCPNGSTKQANSTASRRSSAISRNFLKPVQMKIG